MPDYDTADLSEEAMFDSVDYPIDNELDDVDIYVDNIHYIF